MPKVTSTRREADVGEGEEGWRGEDYRREMVGVMVQIGRMGDSRYFMESRGRVHAHVSVL